MLDQVIEFLIISSRELSKTSKEKDRQNSIEYKSFDFVPCIPIMKQKKKNRTKRYALTE